jgi:hypothetical protein
MLNSYICFCRDVPKFSGQYKVPASLRPLVQMFIVQESMNFDCIQAAVEAITATIKTLHPDMQIILLSYSHRIGIYKFYKTKHRKSGTSSSNKAGPEEDESASVCHHTVQYVHFNSLNSLALDGLDYFDSKPVSAQEPTDDSIHSVLPLAAAADFFEAMTRIGDYRDEICVALSSLFDSFSSTSISSSSAYSYSHGDAGAGTPESSTDFKSTPTPQNLVGPMLDCVAEWIAKPSKAVIREYYQRNNKGEMHLEDDSSNKPNPASISGFFSALKDLGKMLLGSNESAGDDTITTNKTTDDAPRSSDNFAPADYCMGVVINMLFSTPQVCNMLVMCRIVLW